MMRSRRRRCGVHIGKERKVGNLHCTKGHDLGISDEDPYADPTCMECLHDEIALEEKTAKEIAIEILLAAVNYLEEKPWVNPLEGRRGYDCDAMSVAHEALGKVTY